MNDCERLSDRMPEVALGSADWTDEEAAHLGDCGECRAEWELLLAARELDERAPTVSDLAALPGVVQRRLAEDRSWRGARRRAWTFAGAAAAAAILLAVATGREDGVPAGARTVAEAGVMVPLPELEGLETAQLDTLLNSLDRPVAGTSTLDAATLGEHEDGEMEQVLATWEG